MNGQIKTIRGCPPPTVGTNPPQPGDLKVHHVVDALHEIEMWVGSVRAAIGKLPDNTVIPTDADDH